MGGTLQLRASDSGAGWAASVEDGRLIAGRLADAPGPATTTVTATAEDIVLLVWKRRPPQTGVR